MVTTGMDSSATPDAARGAVASMPARTFVLADRLDIDVSICAATVWYLPADPGAVHVLLARDPEHTTTVAISLDLLTSGMYDRVDRGQTTVWPCCEDDVVCVGLRGLHHAVMDLPRTALATFLAEIPAGSGHVADGDLEAVVHPGHAGVVTAGARNHYRRAATRRRPGRPLEPTAVPGVSRRERFRRNITRHPRPSRVRGEAPL
jgi:hypothetical protein